MCKASLDFNRVIYRCEGYFFYMKQFKTAVTSQKSIWIYNLRQYHFGNFYIVMRQHIVFQTVIV